MHRQVMGIALCWVAFAMSAAAQTQTMTGTGTVNTVPMVTAVSTTGTSPNIATTTTLGNSPISVSGSNVGIGTTSPAYELQVSNLTANNAAAVNVIAVTEYHTAESAIGGGYNTAKPSFGISFRRHWYSGVETDLSGIYGYGSQGWQGGLLFMTKVNTTSTGEPDTYAMVIQPNGNVGIGTTSPGAALEVNGSVKLTSGKGGSITFQDGTTQSTAYTGVTCGGDYAESVDVAGDRKSYKPGDVLVIGAESGTDVVKSSEPYSTLVVGVYSTKPGTVGRRQTTDAKTSTTEVPMAMVGIVPVKVSAENGSIKRGDLLVTSSIPGYAMKGTDRGRMLGAVIGKALGALDAGTGVIEMVVTLQ
jgi:hypothetical protein